MNKTVIEMARECLLVSDDGTEESAEYLEAIKRFAALVREETKEKCVSIAIKYAENSIEEEIEAMRNIK